MIHCRDCKHWGAVRGPHREPKPCALLSTSLYAYPYGSPERETRKASTTGDYGHESELNTEPDFGCVQGEIAK